MACVEHVDSVLREITCAHIMSEFAHAMLHGQYACEQLEKSRFPRAIRADKHGALTALGVILHSAINKDIAIGMIDVFKCDHAQTAAHRLREMELDRLPARDRGRDFFHAVRSEEHTSELQSHSDLVCRLLLEKKKKNIHDGLSHDTTLIHLH